MKRFLFIIAAIIFAACSNEVQNSILPFTNTGSSEELYVTLELYDPSNENSRGLGSTVDLIPSHWATKPTVTLTFGDESFTYESEGESYYTVKNNKIIIPITNLSKTETYSISITGADTSYNYTGTLTEITYDQLVNQRLSFPIQHSLITDSTANVSYTLTVYFPKDAWNVTLTSDNVGSFNACLNGASGTFNLTASCNDNDDSSLNFANDSIPVGNYTLHLYANYTDDDGTACDVSYIPLDTGNTVSIGELPSSNTDGIINTATAIYVDNLKLYGSMDTSASGNGLSADSPKYVWTLIKDIASNAEPYLYYDIYCDDFYMILSEYNALEFLPTGTTICITSNNSSYTISLDSSSDTATNQVSWAGDEIRVDATDVDNKTLTINVNKYYSIFRAYLKGGAKVSSDTKIYPWISVLYTDSIEDYAYLNEAAITGLNSPADGTWFFYNIFSSTSYCPSFIYDLDGNLITGYKWADKSNYFFLYNKTE
ncbi:MAG: hypothetical protein K6F15_05105 [Treponema sp.]|nr:hypothetical protein [Treponema sp.]